MIGVGRARKTQFNWVITGAAAVVNIALVLALVPPFGIFGAAIASLVAYVGMFLAMVWHAQRVYPVRYQWRRLALIAAGSAALTVAGRAHPRPARARDRARPRAARSSSSRSASTCRASARVSARSSIAEGARRRMGVTRSSCLVLELRVTRVAAVAEQDVWMQRGVGSDQLCRRIGSVDIPEPDDLFGRRRRAGQSGR